MTARKGATPTARTLALLRSEGYEAGVVERHLPHTRITVDLYSAFDLVAIRADVQGVLGIQTTSGSNHAARVKKLSANAAVRVWLAAGNRAEVWSWQKDPSGSWRCRRAALVLADLAGVEVEEAPRRKRRRKKAEKGLFDSLTVES